jgi:hypothetical protein
MEEGFSAVRGIEAEGVIRRTRPFVRRINDPALELDCFRLRSSSFGGRDRRKSPSQ